MKSPKLSSYDSLISYLEQVQERAIREGNNRAQMVLFRAFQAAYLGNIDKSPSKRALFYMAARAGAVIALQEMSREC